MWRYLIAAFAAGLAACGSKDIEPLHPVQGLLVRECAGACTEFVDVTYLGTGGVLIERRGGARILTAPFFSNPGKFAAGFGRVRPDTAMVRRRMDALTNQTRAVDAILVGHGHYDHLMDVPFLVEQYFEKPPVIYGNQTVGNVLAGRAAGRSVRVVTPGEAGTREREGTWHPTADGRARVMALRSKHAPQVFFAWMPFKRELFREHLTKPLPRTGIEQRDHLPTWAYDWARGDTYAWVIEFLDERGAVEFRAHWQDAASAPRDGWLPASIAHDTTHQLDVAIICAGNFDMVDGYPEAFLRDANPRHVLLGHWESFFTPQGAGSVEMNEVLSGPKMVRRLESVPGAMWNTPYPGTKVRYCLCPRPASRPG